MTGGERSSTVYGQRRKEISSREEAGGEGSSTVYGKKSWVRKEVVLCMKRGGR